MADMQVTTAEVEGFTFLVDPAGFPVVECRRCAARGAIPAYNNVHHGVCFDCNGAGYLHPKHPAGALARQWYAQREARPLDGGDEMTPGMLLRRAGRANTEQWRALATRTPAGVITFPGGAQVTRYELTFTDGSTDTVTCESWHTIPADDAPIREALAAQARTKWAARLRRQATTRTRKATAPVGSLAGKKSAPNNPDLPEWMQL